MAERAQYGKAGRGNRPAPGNMLRLFTISGLLWLCFGCSAGVGYYDLFPSSPVAQQIEQTTGSKLSEASEGSEMGLLLTVPFDGRDFLNSTPAPGFWGILELKSRFISNDVRLDGVSAGLFYNLPIDVNEMSEGLFLMGGFSIGSHTLDIDGLPGETAMGARVSISLDYIKEFPIPFLGPFVEARYQMLKFKTAFGWLDAGGLEVVIGLRMNIVVLYELATFRNRMSRPRSH